MTLEEFEKELAANKKAEENSAKGDRSSHRHREHKSGRHHHRSRRDDGEDEHRRKRRRRSREGNDDEREERRHRSDRTEKRHHHERSSSRTQSPSGIKSNTADKASQPQPLQRDAWMEAPSKEDIEIRYAKPEEPVEPITTHSAKADFELKIHANELNKHHLETMRDQGREAAEVLDEPAQHEVDYKFGDSGSQWRMTRLKGVYQRAEDTGDSVEQIAVKQYGDLRLFDDAREEEIEMDRRKTYGDGYVGKETPSGELFQERKMDAGIRRKNSQTERSSLENEPIQTFEEDSAPRETITINQTSLNKLKAQLMRAKLRKAPEAAALEAQYEASAAAFASGKQPEVIVLSTMENRMLAGGREGEVTKIENRRGRERGLVKENEDMSLDDMVREERRTKGQAGGDGKRFAERIAKDTKFDDDLEYLDENAAKLAKRVQKSEISLRGSAIADLQKTSRILDNCPLCHNEENGQPPVAPVVALATRTYLTLPTEPEISLGGACIVPIQHRKNLLECDDDEWEEIRNFMKALTRMYASRKLSVLFYENAARPERHQHAMLAVVPGPQKDIGTAPGFFREAILQEAPEWAQHKKIIDTAASAKGGMGRSAFKRSMAKEMPYFHVWFNLDGGVGHVVEDGAKWPKGDLFAREVLGEVLQKDFEVIRGRGRWTRGDKRIEGFKKGWDAFDWTKILVQGA